MRGASGRLRITSRNPSGDRASNDGRPLTTIPWAADRTLLHAHSPSRSWSTFSARRCSPSRFFWYLQITCGRRANS